MRKKLSNNLRRIVAAALSAAMVISGAPSMGGITSMAAASDPTFATELEDNVPLMDGRPNTAVQSSHYYDPSTVSSWGGGLTDFLAASYGSGSTTSYKFGWGPTGAFGFQSWKYDIAGIMDRKYDESEITDESLEDYAREAKASGGAGALSVTYPSSNPQGFTTGIGYGATTPTTFDTLGQNAVRESAYSGTNFYPSKDGEMKNGQVVKVFNNAGTIDRELEMKLEVKPSQDKKYILVTYTAYNSDTDGSQADAGRSDNGRTVWLASGTDIMVAHDDWAPIWTTPKTGTGDKIEGIHGQGNNGSTYTLGSYDLLTYHPQYNLGISKRDGSDPSTITSWVGRYTQYAANYFNDLLDHSYMPGGSEAALDSGLAFSFKLDLLPGETKTATIAMSMRGPTYYVDPVGGSDVSGTGFISSPYKTIGAALQAIGSRTPQKVFIFVMGDATIDSTLTIPAGKDVTIQTTDYVMDSSTGSKTSAYPILTDGAGNRTNSLHITRAAGFDGDMFKLDSANSALTFGDIIIDGGNSSTSTGTMVKATAGKLNTQSGAIFQNNKINLLTGNELLGSAIDVSGSASLSMDYGVVENNTSYQGGAVSMTGTGDMTVANDVTINNNVNNAGKKSNLYLGTGKVVSVTERMPSSSRIGINTEDAPANPADERVVVKSGSSEAALPYSATNFPADLSPAQWTTMGSGVNADQVVLKAGQYAYTVTFLRADNGGTLSPAVNLNYMAGHAINQDPVDLTANGYILMPSAEPYTDANSNGVYDTGEAFTDSNGNGVWDAPVEISPALNHGLSVNSTTGNIIGSMPGMDTAITYKYIRNAGVAKFFANGGVPTNIPEIVSAVGGAPSASMPTATRTGYDFAGWFKFADINQDGLYTDGVDILDPTASTALDNPVLLGTTYYVAKWTPDGTGHVFETKYKNNNAALPLVFKTLADNKSFTQPISATPETVPGYLRLTQTVSPVSAGAFDGSFNFAGTMPIQDAEVNYIYKVNTAVKFNFRVIHKTTSGTVLDDVTYQRVAEAPISAAPMNQLGYSLTSNVITAGDTTTPPVLSATDTGCAFDGSGNFSGNMPNQDVTVEFTYASTADYFVIQKYMDTTSNQQIGTPDASGQHESDVLSFPYTGKYGYDYNSAAVSPTTAGTFNATGDFTGLMPASDITLTYQLDRDPAYWKTMTFAVAAAPYNNGSVGTPTTSTFLRDDGSAAAVGNAYTFAKMNELGLVPTATASPAPYYRFAGWYTDAACTTAVSDSATFAGDTTVYAKFEEDPAYWIDVTFAAAAHGSLTGSTSLHTTYDATLGGVAAPTPVPEVNYLFENWTDTASAVVTSATTLVNGMTYTANFMMDPNAWGTDVGNMDPTGQIGFDGGGEIKVHGTQPGDVYIVTDLSGNIIDVIAAPSPATDVTFTDLYPGTRYNVYEGTPDTIAVPGQDISTATGSSISAPQQVLIPVVEGNYTFGYDDQEEGKVQMVINPADPDSDYALIDEDGNVVIAGTGTTDGWKTPVGSNPSTVTFTGLNPGEQYTVVARKKGDTSATPLSKLPDGSLVVANPGDEFEVPKYIVETKNGEIVTVAGNAIGAARFDEAHEGETVTIHAEATNGAGQPFKYWKVIAGHCDGITGRVTTQDVTFVMEGTNVVLSAVYEKDHTASPSTADVEEEVKGGAAEDFALDPADISSLEEDLTTDADRVLMDQNGADVTYRIVFNKRDTTSSENALVKSVSIAGMNHPDAYRAAWSLDIYADRYVNGRKVARATPSDATTGVIVQLEAEDIDMLDYELFDVTAGVPVVEGMSENPELTAGLFTFTGTIGHTYVLVYSRTFKLRFIDNNPVMNYLHLNDMSYNFAYTMKVRRKEAASDSDYSFDYNQVCNYADGSTAYALDTPFEDIYGVQYDYQNWYKKNVTMSIDSPVTTGIFDPDAEVTKTMVLYACYANNRNKVNKARVDLTSLIGEAHDLAGDPFLKLDEVNTLNAEIARAQAVIDKIYPTDPRMANYAELQQAFSDLKALMDSLRALIATRRNVYTSTTGGSSGGGTGSGGRGNGSAARPLEASVEKVFSLGVDGSWSQRANGTWSFVLNGGLPLNSKWGKIQYRDESGNLRSDWYYFNGQSEMVTGWMHDDKDNKWYYFNPAAGINNGQMKTGWLLDTDGQWYYLDPVLGEMYIGWHMIGEQWYYFTPNTVAGHPAGALYVSTTTPDGYAVNANGEWVR